MRTFNERELQLIRSLIDYSTGQSLSMQDFLQKNYFKEELNRALIIQNQGEYAILFLKQDFFAQEERKTSEISCFFELLGLIGFLVKEGYLVLYRDKTEKMYYIQDGFDAVKIVNNNTIVLNTKGYYTSVPDTIHDSHKNVVYKGIEFKGEQYQLILNYCASNLIISSEIAHLLDVPKAPVPQDTHEEKAASPPAKKKVLPLLSLCLSALLLILFCVSGIYAYLRQKHFSSTLVAMNTLTQSVNDSVASVLSELSDLKKKPQHTILDPHNEYGHFFGLDISKWNGNEITEIPLKDSITFIICKATEGAEYIDPDFSKNWDLIRNRSYILGAYHFYHTSEDPVKQAQHFITTLISKGQTDISPIVDIEQASIPENNTKSAEQIQKDLLLFLKQLEIKCKRTPIIYTGLAFADEFLKNKELSHYPLWLAEYTSASAPRIPVTWQESGYKIWQRRDNYFIDSHTSDLDLFYGSKQDLLK